MYFRSECPKCRCSNWHDIHVAFKNSEWEDIYLKETVTEEILVSQVLKGVRGRIKDGMETGELCRILVDIYGVAKNFCCDLIQRIKLELGLYCPDCRHLYYVN